MFAALLCAAGVVQAQEQEKKLSDSFSSNPNMSQVNPMQNQAYGSEKFSTKDFSSGSYNGIKNADVKSYETRSFFGLKNPWFGRKVFDAPTSSLTSRSARESREQFQTDAFAVKQFEKASKENLADSSAPVPAADQPRPYLVPGKTQQGIDKFTQNLKKDLTIDDVRDLLNKGTDK